MATKVPAKKSASKKQANKPAAKKAAAKQAPAKKPVAKQAPAKQAAAKKSAPAAKAPPGQAASRAPTKDEAIWIGAMSIDASDVSLAIMDGAQVRTWEGDPDQVEAHGAVGIHFHDFKVDLWRTIDGFAFVEAYPDTGSLGDEFKNNAPLQQAMGKLLATLEAHDPDPQGTLRVTSGCIGLIAEEHAGTHVTAADLATAAAAQAVTNVDLRGDLAWGNLALVGVPNGEYEISEERLSAEGVYEDPQVGEVHTRISVRRIGK